MNFGSGPPREMCPRAWDSMRRVCQLLSRLTLTVSNVFCIFFVLPASTKDGPIKLFCRLLLTECVEYLRCAPVGHTVPSIFPLHRTLTHCILTLCLREVLVLAVCCPRFAHTFQVNLKRRDDGPLSRHPGSCATFLSPRGKECFSF